MITFRSVTKRFGDEQPALENVSFHVDPGEFLFLTGQSGSGKTTLLKLLTKEYIPTEGDVEFQGKLLSKMRGNQIHHHRRTIGVVFQDYRLLPDLNVWENIALALQIIGKKQSEIEERVTDLLELVQLTERAYHFPAQLSGGESQRVGIARALATAPSVLLADEPTGNLDPQNTLLIARLFDRINQLGTTILFATHDVSVLQTLQHRRLILDKGKLIDDSGKDKTSPSKTHSAPQQEAPSKVSAVAQEKPAVQKETPVKAAASSDSEKKNTEIQPKAVPEKSTKPRFQFPKFSLPFGKKKPKETETEAIPPQAKIKIEQETLDDGPLKLTPKPKTKKESDTVIEVETLREMIKEHDEKGHK